MDYHLIIYHNINLSKCAKYSQTTMGLTHLFSITPLISVLLVKAERYLGIPYNKLSILTGSTNVKAVEIWAILMHLI